MMEAKDIMCLSGNDYPQIEDVINDPDNESVVVEATLFCHIIGTKRRGLQQFSGLGKIPIGDSWLKKTSCI